MNFLVYKPFNHSLATKININKTAQIENSELVQIFLFNNELITPLYEIELPDYIYIFIGDIVAEPKMNLYSYLKDYTQKFSSQKIRNLNGFFYIIQINKVNQAISIYNSVFSILPIYYHITSEAVFVASRCDLIKSASKKQFSINKKFILSKTLFNYPLFNETIYTEIKLTPSNSFISLDKIFEIQKHTTIGNLFEIEPAKWKKSTNQLSDLFINEIDKYFPEDKVYISYTGGFDGRTILACGLNQNINQNTYSFGTSESADVCIPNEQSKLLNINHLSIDLNEVYCKSSFLPLGKQLIDLTEGNSSFSRAHYLFAALILSKKTKYILTGNFGSELFRSMHIAGEMTPSEIISIFKYSNPKNWIRCLKNSNKLKYLQFENFKQEFDELIENIYNYKLSLNKHHTLNQQFYVFMFEEVFRKYFGPEIIMQFNYLNNRTPFLNFSFIEKLLKTELAGVYSDFFEHNPIKRFKGQVLYAHIIKKAYPTLAHLPTDKGYKPIDIISNTGKANLAISFLYKRFFKKSYLKTDPFAVKHSMDLSAKELKSWDINEEIYNKFYISEMFEKNIWSLDKNGISIALSSNYYMYKDLK